MLTSIPTVLPSPRCPLSGLLNKLPSAPLRLCVKRPPLLLLSLILATTLHAGVPYRWTVETSAPPAPANVPLFRGETLDLSATMLSYGTALPLAATTTCTFYWQTNGMDQLYWTIPGTLTNNILSATWTPSCDLGATTYTFFLGAATPGGRVYRAHGRLRMIGSPADSSATPPVATAAWDARYDLAGAAQTVSNAHNTDPASHADIRALIPTNAATAADLVAMTNVLSRSIVDGALSVQRWQMYDFGSQSNRWLILTNDVLEIWEHR